MMARICPGIQILDTRYYSPRRQEDERKVCTEFQSRSRALQSVPQEVHRDIREVRAHDLGLSRCLCRLVRMLRLGRSVVLGLDKGSCYIATTDAERTCLHWHLPAVCT
jgi:hypothetical protein